MGNLSEVRSCFHAIRCNVERLACRNPALQMLREVHCRTPHRRGAAHLASAGDEYEKALKEPFSPLPDPGACVNLHEMCDQWAKAGECTVGPEQLAHLAP
jgi:hypothetical protein